MATVYVVFSYTNYRKNNEGEVIGVYTTLEKAKAILQDAVMECASYDDVVDVDKIEWFNSRQSAYIDIDPYTTFEIKAVPLED